VWRDPAGLPGRVEVSVRLAAPVLALGLAPPRYSGLAAYRALVDAGRLSALPAEPDVVIWLGPGQHAVRYPVSRQGWVNVVATAPVPQWDSPSWTVPAQPADLRIAYRDWHPHVRSVLGSADRVTRWALLTAPLGPRLHGARIALVGDAAQTMLLNALTANQASETLCISRETLEVEFLIKHFMQHYQTMVGSLLTWRQVRDWLDAASLPEWVVAGRSV